jgi:hypothetical protein
MQAPIVTFMSDIAIPCLPCQNPGDADNAQSRHQNQAADAGIWLLEGALNWGQLLSGKRRSTGTINCQSAVHEP